MLHFWPVSRMVNAVRNNGADLLDRVDDPNALPSSVARLGRTRRDRLRPSSSNSSRDIAESLDGLMND